MRGLQISDITAAKVALSFAAAEPMADASGHAARETPTAMATAADVVATGGALPLRGGEVRR